jgi:outer membrane protein TolC
MIKRNNILFLLILLAGGSYGQTLSLDTILARVEMGNPANAMYANEIKAMDAAAGGARSWMPPEFSTGLWMTPYNPGLWKKSDMNATGMGQYMIGGQQMFPNRKKLDADAAYMQNMSSVEKEKLKATWNEQKSDAKLLYYEWVILEKKLSVLDQNGKMLEFMIKNAELRYKNGLDKISAYYKAVAALGNVKNMQLMYAGDIREKRIRLNTLMGQPALASFSIDTSYAIRDFSGMLFDSTYFFANRSELKAVDREIDVAYLMQEAEKRSLAPQFGIRYEHMFGFGGLPMQFSLMGMMKLPLASWSSKMSKANAESLKWKASSLQSRKEMLVNEYSGMAYGMKNELELKVRQMKLYENNIIPALRNNYKTAQMGYEQNTEELFMLFDAWETLNMTQLEYLGLLARALELQVTLERILEIR